MRIRKSNFGSQEFGLCKGSMQDGLCFVVSVWVGGGGLCGGYSRFLSCWNGLDGQENIHSTQALLGGGIHSPNWT